jgi:hypothetical protein
MFHHWLVKRSVCADREERLFNDKSIRNAFTLFVLEREQINQDYLLGKPIHDTSTLCLAIEIGEFEMFWVFGLIEGNCRDDPIMSPENTFVYVLQSQPVQDCSSRDCSPPNESDNLSSRVNLTHALAV